VGPADREVIVRLGPAELVDPLGHELGYLEGPAPLKTISPLKVPIGVRSPLAPLSPTR
jgi:hypothetical protein